MLASAHRLERIRRKSAHINIGHDPAALANFYELALLRSGRGGHEAADLMFQRSVRVR